MSPRLNGRGFVGIREAATPDSELAATSANRSCASMVFLRGDLSADEVSSVRFDTPMNHGMALLNCQQDKCH